MTDVRVYGDTLLEISDNTKEIAEQLKELVRIVAIFVDRE
jgi:hypothetical protein